MKTRILITGATGKTGLPLAQELADRKVPFRALVHSVLKEHLVRRWTSDIVAGDYEDRDAWMRPLTGSNASTSSPRPRRDQEKIQTSLVDIAKKKGVKHIVKLSALGDLGTDRRWDSCAPMPRSRITSGSRAWTGRSCSPISSWRTCSETRRA